MKFVTLALVFISLVVAALSRRRNPAETLCAQQKSSTACAKHTTCHWASRAAHGQNECLIASAGHAAAKKATHHRR